VRTRWCAWV